MKLSLARTFLAFVTLVLTSACATGFGPNRSPAHDLLMSDMEVSLDQETRTHWHADLFQSEEIWVIKHERRFFSNLALENFDPKHIGMIEAHFHKYLPSRVGPIGSFWSDAYNVHGGFVLLPQEVKDQLPTELLREVYSVLYDNDHAPPHLSDVNRDSLEASIRSWGHLKPSSRDSSNSWYLKMTTIAWQ